MSTKNFSDITTYLSTCDSDHRTSKEEVERATNLDFLQRVSATHHGCSELLLPRALSPACPFNNKAATRLRSPSEPAVEAIHTSPHFPAPCISRRGQFSKPSRCKLLKLDSLHSIGAFIAVWPTQGVNPMQSKRHVFKLRSTSE
jgi:hypothetical protein